MSRATQLEGTTQKVAAHTGGDASEIFAEADHWDRLAELDVSRGPDDELADMMATELARQYFLGHFTWDEWRMFGFWGENEVHTTLKEYPDDDSLCNGTDYWIMYGQREGRDGENARPVKPPLRAEDNRRLWSLADAKRAGMTGAVGGRFLKALTEITAVSRTEMEEIDQESKGWLGKLKERL